MAKALGRIKDPRAIGALTEAVTVRGNEDLRVCAIQSLGMIGDKRAVPTLIEALKQRNMPVEAAKSLAQLDGADAASLVHRATQLSDPARATARCSARMIRHFAGFRAQADAATTVDTLTH